MARKEGNIPTRDELEQMLAQQVGQTFLDQLQQHRQLFPHTQLHLDLPTDLGTAVLSKLLTMLMCAEMDAFLGYERYVHTTSGQASERNYRNGFYWREVITNNGPLKVAYPRDRLGKFASVILPKGVRDISHLQDKLLELAALGSSTRKMSIIVRSLLGVQVSHEYVHRVLERFVQQVRLWQQSNLSGRSFPFLFLDCTFVPIRDAANTAIKRPLYVVMGIDDTGHKAILDFDFLGNKETLDGWKQMLNRLCARGLTAPYFVCSDGVVGLNKVIASFFPQAHHQRCIVHLVRNSLDYITNQQRAAWCQDLKAVYRAADEDSAREALASLEHKWQGTATPAVTLIKMRFNSTILPLLSLPPHIRQVVYTTNAIEAVNSSLQNVLPQGSFKSTGSVLSMLYLRVCKVLEPRWLTPEPDWELIATELQQIDPNFHKGVDST